MTVVVFDIGKTNLKLLAIDDTGRVLGQRSTANKGVAGPPYLHVDVGVVEKWLLEALGELARRHAIEAVVTTAHGSGGVLVDERGPVLPMVDYEGTPPDWLDQDYAAVRPSYRERGSAPMGAMTHVGRQMFWLAKGWPEAFARARAFLTLPQYWAWRLSGVMASEITSLAAQSHLWNVIGRRPSSLVTWMGWESLLPPLRPAWDRLGPIRGEVARQTGLSRTTLVLNGLHDSSGNLYRYQRAGLGEATLLSTGTWIVGLRAGLPPERLVEERAMTLNADVTGTPVGGVLAMVGRELDTIAPDRRGHLAVEELQAVVDAGTLALPSFVPMDGIFPGSAGKGRVVGPAVAGLGLGMLYAALVAETCLELLATEETVVIDGGFTGEPMFAGLVKALRPELRVLDEPVGGGTALGAALLWSHDQKAPPLKLEAVEPVPLRGLAAYRERWREMLSGIAPDGRGGRRAS